MEILAAILILAGLAGSVLPLLPGPPISFIGLLIYAYKTGFSETGNYWLLIFGLLTVLSVILDYVAPSLGAKKYKASKFGTAGALIGSFLGVLSIGPFGILTGPLIGGFIGEFIYKREFKSALQSALGSFIGFLAGTLFRLMVSLAIAIYFFVILLT